MKMILAMLGFLAWATNGGMALAQIVPCDNCGQFQAHMVDDQYRGSPSSNVICFWVQSDEPTALQMRLDQNLSGPIIGQLNFRRQEGLWEDLGQYGYRRQVCMTRTLWSEIRTSGRWLNPCGALGNYDISPRGLEWIEQNQSNPTALMRRPACLSGSNRCRALGLDGF